MHRIWYNSIPSFNRETTLFLPERAKLLGLYPHNGYIRLVWLVPVGATAVEDRIFLVFLLGNEPYTIPEKAEFVDIIALEKMSYAVFEARDKAEGAK